MIIVSQDKERIVNFNNIQDIRIEEYGTHIKTKKIYKIFSGNFEGYVSLLGTYETKERAKEVLQEIIKEYKATEAFKACADRIADKVGAIAIEEGFAYEMPLE